MFVGVWAIVLGQHRMSILGFLVLLVVGFFLDFFDFESSFLGLLS